MRNGLADHGESILHPDDQDGGTTGTLIMMSQFYLAPRIFDSGMV
jgi:hypothetical protein